MTKRHAALNSLANNLTKAMIKKELSMCFLGIAFSFSAFRAVLDLQTSINIQDGLGSISGSVLYGTAILGCIAFAPVFLMHAGAKKSIVLCDVLYLLFTLANFHAVFGTMIPASLLTGLAEALIFPSLSLFNLYYAEEYSKLSGRNGVQHYLKIFTGKCFGIVYLTRVTGNLTSFLVMRIGTTGEQPTNVSAFSFLNESTQNTEMLKFCGVNDCQDPEITKTDLSKYMAPKMIIYILLSIFVIFGMIALIIHWLAMSEIRSLSERMGGNEIIFLPEETTMYEEGTFGSHQRGVTTQIMKTLKKCTRQFVNPYQLLLLSSQAYAGLQLTFVTTEVSRAYVSCMLGVEQVGLAIAIFGAVGGISSYFNGILSTRIGRSIPLLCAMVLDIIVYIFCLTWVPSDSTLWIVYIICGAGGYSSGIWQSATNAICGKFFQRDQEVAFSVWALFFSCGMALQYGWSTLLCVNTKIYISLAILCVSAVLYGIAEILYQRRAKIKRRRSSAKVLTDEM